MRAETYEEYLKRRERLTDDIVHAQKELDGARDRVGALDERYKSAPESERPELDRETGAAQRDVRTWEDARDGAIAVRSQYDLENHEFDDARERGEPPKEAAPEPVDPLTRLHQFTAVVGIVAHMTPAVPVGIPADHPALWQAPPAQSREIEMPNADEMAEHVKTKSIPSELEFVQEHLKEELDEATRGHEPDGQRKPGDRDQPDDAPSPANDNDPRAAANDNNPRVANDNNPRAAANDNGPRTAVSVAPAMPDPNPPAARIATTPPPANDNNRPPDDPRR